MVNKHEEWCKAVSKKVYQLDKLTGELIKIHSSIYKAALELGNLGMAGNISKVIDNAKKSAYGFKWSSENVVVQINGKEVQGIKPFKYKK